MNTISKLALSLLVAGSAVGFSAFKRAEKSASILSPFVYQLIDGRYEPVNPSTALECNSASELTCKLETPTEQVGGFSTDNIPNDATPYEDSPNGEYITPPAK